MRRLSELCSSLSMGLSLSDKGVGSCRLLDRLAGPRFRVGAIRREVDAGVPETLRQLRLAAWVAEWTAQSFDSGGNGTMHHLERHGAGPDDSGTATSWFQSKPLEGSSSQCRATTTWKGSSGQAGGTTVVHVKLHPHVDSRTCTHSRCSCLATKAD